MVGEVQLQCSYPVFYMLNQDLKHLSNWNQHIEQKFVFPKKIRISFHQRCAVSTLVNISFINIGSLHRDFIQHSIWLLFKLLLHGGYLTYQDLYRTSSDKLGGGESKSVVFFTLLALGRNESQPISFLHVNLL